ncbi:type II toxin-antitoxin system VapC family toxin [Granulicella sibirica]|uniref:Ribonuclease VapC n=1 Tax=Granulicella sibirica TaxID=2479048 RepID=A0A4Q0T070_9BACT|nr:type II toxin-antitoxin system VapC family toxin [Granulicella sibirica]RXH54766.1 VapC toxin protein [Granulicella sibirica]
MRGTTLYLLDTNTFAYIVNGRSPAARAQMTSLIEHSPLAISAITEGEILYGLAKKPEATRLRAAVESLLATVLVLPWDSAAAGAYGTLRAQLASAGKTLSAMDMLIAAHAIAADAILVTSDKAFSQVEALRPVANWATDI